MCSNFCSNEYSVHLFTKWGVAEALQRIASSRCSSPQNILMMIIMVVWSYPFKASTLKTLMTLWIHYWSPNLGFDFGNEKLELCTWLRKSYRTTIDILKLNILIEGDQVTIRNVNYTIFRGDTGPEEGHISKSSFLPWQHNVLQNVALTTCICDTLNALEYTLSVSSSETINGYIWRRWRSILKSTKGKKWDTSRALFSSDTLWKNPWVWNFADVCWSVRRGTAEEVVKWKGIVENKMRITEHSVYCLLHNEPTTSCERKTKSVSNSVQLSVHDSPGDVSSLF